MTKRVVFVGAGHAHLYALKRTAEFIRRGHEVVAIAPDLFWYSGLATGMLGGLYPPELDQVDVGALVEAGGGRFLQDRIVGLDRAARLARLAAGAPLAYDALSLTLGSEPPPIPGADASDTVYSVKPIRRVYELRAALERRFAAAPDHPVRVVIAGGGVTGCELAANIARLAAANQARIALRVLAGGPAILKQLPGGAAARVRRALEARGIVFRPNSRVERIEQGHAIVAGAAAEPFDFFVNAAGLEPAPVTASLGLPVDGKGALLLDDHLRSVADPAVHGGGDCVAIGGHQLPRIGVYAIREAPILFDNLLAALEGGEPRRFRPQRRFLWIMNLGDGTGLAARGRLWWHGRLAFRLKDWIDRRFLSEYQRAARGER